MGQIFVGLENNLGKKNLGRTFFWVKKMFGPKKIMSEIYLGQKKLGRKFVLAYFYFGFIRFVCVKLLLLADLNNNNTEFDKDKDLATLLWPEDRTCSQVQPSRL